MIHQLTNTKSYEETEDSEQPIGMRESGEKAKDTDYETIHINCMSSAKLVCERTDTYSTEKETQKNHGGRYRHVDCLIANEIKLK